MQRKYLIHHGTTDGSTWCAEAGVRVEGARASQLAIVISNQIKSNQIKSVLEGRSMRSQGRAAVWPQLYINCSQASYLWTVAATGLAAADTAVEAVMGLDVGVGVGVGEAAGSRTSWSVAVVCSAMPKLRHQEGKHELGRSTR
ncbi:hypothetical protein GGI35DRAFT_201584 [Trichoderma velutinum]